MTNTHIKTSMLEYCEHNREKFLSSGFEPLDFNFLIHWIEDGSIANFDDLKKFGMDF